MLLFVLCFVTGPFKWIISQRVFKTKPLNTGYNLCLKMYVICTYKSCVTSGSHDYIDLATGALPHLDLTGDPFFPRSDNCQKQNEVGVSLSCSCLLQCCSVRNIITQMPMTFVGTEILTVM